MSFRLFLSIAAAALVALAIVGPFLDRVVFPEPAPGPEYIPAVGQVFHSVSEGFTQRIVKHEGGLLWSELTMRAHAPGPPPHIHAAFAERFRVEKGTVAIRLADEVVELHAGEEYLVKPGTLHKPFNPTGEEAVISGSTTDYALPGTLRNLPLPSLWFLRRSPGERSGAARDPANVALQPAV